MLLALIAMFASDDDFPAKCARANRYGELPTCTQYGDGTWHASYPSDASSFGSGFATLFVFVLLGGVAITIWKVSTARRMARDSGMNVGDATAMTLLTDNGFESTYLASNLRQPTATSAAPEAKGSTADRLEELQALHTRGLITDQELAEGRRKILDGL